MRSCQFLKVVQHVLLTDVVNIQIREYDIFDSFGVWFAVSVGICAARKAVQRVCGLRKLWHWDIHGLREVAVAVEMFEHHIDKIWVVFFEIDAILFAFLHFVDQASDDIERSEYGDQP